MNCQQVREWLLEAENPLAGQPADVAAHSANCAACREAAAELARLDSLWRSLPLPAEAERSKQAFLAGLACAPAARQAPPRRFSRRRILQWCATSAAGLLVAGGGGWLVFSAQQAQAYDDLLDHLVDWNLRISQAHSQAERIRLYDQQANHLRAMIRKSKFSAEAVAVLNDYFDNGDWLVSHSDPVGEADRFSGLADRLLQLAAATDGARNSKRLNRLLRQYNRVLESGVEVKIAAAEASGAMDFEHQKKLEQLILADPQRIKNLAAILERSPHASRKEIEQAIRTYDKRKKKAKPGKVGPGAGKAKGERRITES